MLRSLNIASQKAKQAVALAMALTLVVLMSLLVWAFLNNGEAALFSSFRMASSVKALYLAEGGIRYFLTIRDKWDQARVEKIQIGDEEITLQVVPKPNKSNFILVRSSATVAGTTRTIEIKYDLQGRPVKRWEK